MPLYKPVDFARECGLSKAHISVYKRRGKLVFNADGLVDVDHPLNAAFLKKMQEKKKINPEKVESKTTELSPEEIKRQEQAQELIELDRQSKRMALESKRKEQALLDAKIQKMHGVLIPTDMVKIIFAQHFREISTSFKQGMDGLLSEIAKKARLNGNQVAEMRVIITKMINESVNKAVDNSKKNVETIVTEYASTKNAA